MSIILPLYDSSHTPVSANGKIVSVDTTGKLIVTTGTTGITRTVLNAATYTLSSTDTLLAVTYTPTGIVNITLPDVTSNPNIVCYVVDEGGNAGTNNITLTVSGSDTFFGGTEYIINNNYNSVHIYNDGSSKWGVL
jgi:hypothetical protein